MLKIATLFSGAGSTMMNLIDATHDGRLPDAAIVRAIASRPDAGGIAKVRAAGVPCDVVPRKDFGEDIDAFSDAVFAHLKPGEVDLVCLCGWMCLLKLPEVWDGRIINIHPSLLPEFGGKGMFGRRVHEAVLAAGHTKTGCTVHVVDDQYDNGPVLLQHPIAIEPGDTAEQVEQKVQAAERAAYPWGIEVWRTLAKIIEEQQE